MSPVPHQADAIGDLVAALAHFDVRDLSHVLEEGIPHFPTHTGFHHMDVGREDDPAMMFQILMHEHNGTHVDAPAHYIADGPDPERDFLHSVDPAQLICPAAIVHADTLVEDLLPAQRLLAWEEENGPVTRGEAVIFNFGWHRKWKTGPDGAAFVARWPGISRDLAELLVTRGVRAVGTDCLGLDCSGSTEIPAHDLLLQRHVLIMESLAALDGLPPRIFFIAAPLRIRNGSGSPVRALALLPKTETR